MKLTGSYEIYAPRETVWRTITQPESLKGCIPRLPTARRRGGR